MNEYKLSYQGIIFINTKKVSADTSTISKLVEEFSEFELLPSTYQELTVKGVISRVRMITQDGELEVRFGSKNVVIEKKPKNIEESSLGTVDDFGALFNALAKKVFKITDRKSNRLSLITSYIYEGISDTELKKIQEKIFKPHPFHKDRDTFEWNSRLVSREQFDIGGEETDINVIHFLNRVKGNLNQEGMVKGLEGLNLKFDINTATNDSDPNFTADSIDDFINLAINQEKDLKRELIEFIQ